MCFFLLWEEEDRHARPPYAYLLSLSRCVCVWCRPSCICPSFEPIERERIINVCLCVDIQTREKKNRRLVDSIVQEPIVIFHWSISSNEHRKNKWFQNFKYIIFSSIDFDILPKESCQPLSSQLSCHLTLFFADYCLHKAMKLLSLYFHSDLLFTRVYQLNSMVHTRTCFNVC